MQVQSVKSKHERLRSSKAGSTRAQELQREVHEDCVGVIYMLDEVDKSVDAAEKNPKRFKLSQAEISERRKWVMSTRRRLETYLQDISSLPEVKDGNGDGPRVPEAEKYSLIPEESRQAEMGTSASRLDHSASNTVAGKLERSMRDENDAFIRSEGQHQAQIMAQQDTELDVLSHHVVRIGELGREMGQELDSQGQLLDEFGEEMEVTGTRLAAAQRKVQYVLDKAGTKGQLLIILVLVVVLVILIFLAIA